MAVDIDAAHLSLAFYSSGLWHDKDCKPDELDHAVLLVGYGTDNSTGVPMDYWLIKNSWSSYWGDEGYVKIAQKPNDCGVTSSPNYAMMKDGNSKTTAKPVPPKTDSSGASALSFTLSALVLMISITQLHNLS